MGKLHVEMLCKRDSNSEMWGSINIQVRTSKLRRQIEVGVE